MAIRKDGSAAARRPAITQPVVPPDDKKYQHWHNEVSEEALTSSNDDVDFHWRGSHGVSDLLNSGMKLKEGGERRALYCFIPQGNHVARGHLDTAARRGIKRVSVSTVNCHCIVSQLQEYGPCRIASFQPRACIAGA